MFQRLYDRVIDWSKHRHAQAILLVLSFAESSFFPIPPDVMLVPMALAKPQGAMKLAFWTTIASVVGGMFGYGIGYFLFDQIEPWLQSTHYWAAYLQATAWFNEWGFWAVLIAGFSPIPYKVFTIAAGALSMVFLPFVLASMVGRGGRFFLLAILIAAGGDRLESKLREYMNQIGWASVLLVLIGTIIYQIVR